MLQINNFINRIFRINLISVEMVEKKLFVLCQIRNNKYTTLSARLFSYFTRATQRDFFLNNIKKVFVVDIIDKKIISSFVRIITTKNFAMFKNIWNYFLCVVY